MPMITDTSPIVFRDDLPASIDVIVIGAGVAGVSTALFLRERGVSVLVCEKGRVAGEQSSRNWGWIRQQRRDPAELPIMMESIGLWERLASEVDEDIGFARHGVVRLAETEAELDALAQWLPVAEQHQLETRLLNASEVDELVSGRPRQWRGGLYTPSDGRAEPFKAVPALARLLQHRGGLVRESCAVRWIDREGGRVAGVITEEGLVRTQAVVCAAGAWSALVVRHLGVRLPQLTVRATVARTARAPDLFAGNANAGDIAFRRRNDGGYTVAAAGENEHFVSAETVRHFKRFLPSLFSSRGYMHVRLRDDPAPALGWPKGITPDRPGPFEAVRVLNPPPSIRAVQVMRERLARRLPRLAGLRFEEAWAGMIDVTPDVVPVLDEVTGNPGLYLATGFSGHGFGIGPGAGRVMADLVTGRASGHDLRRFRFARFFDGSPVEPGPGL